MSDNRQITSYHKHDDFDQHSKEHEHSDSRRNTATTRSQIHQPGNLHGEMYGYKDHRTVSNQPVYAVHGVKFTMTGFWYKGFYYKRLCSKTRLYHALSTCSRIPGGVESCLPWLYKQHLIGRREVFMKDGHGIGIKFDIGSIIFGPIFYNIHCRVSRLRRYMNMCVHKYGDTLICLIKLQNMGWIGKSRVFRDVYLKDLAKKIHTVEPHRPAVKKTISKKTITFINGRFVYKGKEYRLKCTQKNFIRLWYRCIGRYHLESTCFRRLRILKIFIPYVKGYYGDHYPVNPHIARHLVYSADTKYLELPAHGETIVNQENNNKPRLGHEDVLTQTHNVVKSDHKEGIKQNDNKLEGNNLNKRRHRDEISDSEDYDFPETEDSDDEYSNSLEDQSDY